MCVTGWMPWARRAAGRGAAARAFHPKPLLLCALLLSGIAPAAAEEITPAWDGDADDCPTEWAEYVSAVGDIVGPLGQDPAVIFVTREGEAFDCLDLIDGNYLLERASNFFERDPRPRSPVDPSDPGNWPTNVCNVAHTRLPNLPLFLAVELTRQVDVLDHPVCRVRVVNSLRFFFGNRQ